MMSALRLRQLDAMGIRPYQLRSRVAAGAPAEPAEAASQALPATVHLAVICEEPRGAASALIAAALGLAETALRWHVPQSGRLADLDQDAAAFLVLGNHLARVLGAELPTAAQQAATIVVTAAPAQWRGDAMAKRLLWQALRPLRRHLREQAWSPS
jgi:DNA polymerase III psi subunit